LLTRDAGASAASGEALAKVGSALRALYESYQAARANGRVLIAPDPSLPTVEDRVAIDATAAQSERTVCS
jgi:hypothetical protein